MGSETYIITGGFGQIGLYLTRRLLASGRRALLFDQRLDLAELALICGEDAAGRLAFATGDLAAPTAFLSLVAQHRPAAIVHLASMLPPVSERNAPYTMQQNTMGMLNVLEAARIFGVRRVLFASAASVFGRPERHGGLDLPLDDLAPHFPETLYGISKSANEQLAAYYHRQHGLETIGFRICQGYGPGKRRGRAFGWEVFENALNGNHTEVPCGDDLVNWQYIEDIAEIFERGLDAPHRGLTTYNTSGEVHTMRDSIETLRAIAPSASFTLLPGVSGLVWRYRTSRLETDIGFRKPTPMADGFAATLDTMRRWRDRNAISVPRHDVR